MLATQFVADFILRESQRNSLKLLIFVYSDVSAMMDALRFRIVIYFLLVILFYPVVNPMKFSPSRMRYYRFVSLLLFPKVIIFLVLKKNFPFIFSR